MDIRRRMLFKKKASSGGGGGSEGPINTDNYLTIEARENGLTASLSINACEYCVDGDGDWKSLAAGIATESINSGQTLSFRGNLTPTLIKGIGTFTISKKCNLKGNCMSMLFGDNAVDNYSLSDKRSAFFKLFYECSNIVTVSSGFLPATTLGSYCYSSMFYGCTSLTTAPELPATTLAESCYYEMFEDCTSLTTAPELPATTLAKNCYQYMFQGCTNLTTAPKLPATTLAIYCYSYMFDGCKKLRYIKMLATDISASDCLSSWVKGVAGTGTFVKNPAMTTLPIAASSNKYAGIPSGWTVVNDGEESGGGSSLIENNISLIVGLKTYVQSEYPVESDIVVELKDISDTYTLTIVNGNSKSTQSAPPPTFNEWKINSVTPSEDKVYKYTF